MYIIIYIYYIYIYISEYLRPQLSAVASASAVADSVASQVSVIFWGFNTFNPYSVPVETCCSPSNSHILNPKSHGVGSVASDSTFPDFDLVVIFVV